MKKSMLSITALLTATLLTTGMLSGCGGTKSPSSTSPSAPAATAATEEQEITLSAIVAGLPEASPSGEALKKFAQLTEEYSGGSVKVDTFFNQDLGSLTTCVESMSQGTLDIVSTGTSYFSGYVPEIQVFELPYVFSSNDEARQTLDGAPGDEVAKLFESKGIKLLCYWESGLRHVTNNKGPIVTPDDMKGLKIRTVVSETQQKTWESFGALPMALDMGETFTALQQGTVDAQENTLAQIVSLNMNEVQKYISLTGHAYTPMPFGISTTTWAKLSETQQQAVLKASQEARDYQRELDDKSDIDNVALLKEKGMTVEENPDKEAFAKCVQPVYDTFSKAVGGDTYLVMVQDFVKGLKK